jgi:hypothetical protein
MNYVYTISIFDSEEETVVNGVLRNSFSNLEDAILYADFFVLENSGGITELIYGCNALTGYTFGRTDFLPIYAVRDIEGKIVVIIYKNNLNNQIDLPICSYTKCGNNLLLFAEYRNGDMYSLRDNEDLISTVSICPPIYTSKE